MDVVSRAKNPLLYGLFFSDQYPGVLVMAAVSVMAPKVLPLIIPPRVSIRFRLLRDGESSAERKYLRIYRDWDTISQLCYAFYSDDEYTASGSFDLATLLAQGEWLAAGVSLTPPKRTRAVYLTLSESGTFTFNIASGEGGNPGTPGVVQARVRVDGVLASREVVLVEKPSDGQWRMAGYGPTLNGEGTIDVRVTDGSLYAIGLDDWGTVFTADLAVTVDQTIRPSIFTGWLYRITEPGTLPAAEPEWWPSEGDNASRLLGTARAIAVRYYQPLAHGPLPVELL